MIPDRGDVPAVELRGVTRRFGRSLAVDRVDLRVDDGELLALVGPSGCGKSTLLLLVAGLLQPDEGEIRVGSRLVAGPGAWVPPEQRRVGVVFQDAALFPHLRVADNIAFGLTRGPDRAGRVAELLELVDLPGLGARYPHELSGGQQQRVALARALAPRPRVVLFDEAFGNLDSGLRAAVRAQTVVALREAGAAGVLVTHDQSEALAVGDRVAVMQAGRFEHVASPAEVFHRPATRFSATLLGEADFVPGQQTGDTVETELGRLDVVPAGGGRVEVMLRPHEVTLHPAPLAAVPGRSGRVVAREFRGACYLYTVRLPSGGLVRSLQPHTTEVAPGAVVDVGVEAGHPLRSFPV